MKKTRAQSLENRTAWRWALLVLIVGLLFSTWIAISIQRSELEKFQNRVDQSAERFLTHLRTRLDNYGPSLAAARALFVGAERSQITVRSFQGFSESLQLLEEMHAPPGLGYAARIPEDQFNAYQNRLRASPNPRYQISNAAPGQAERLIIELFEPEFINGRYLGVDLSATPRTRQAAMLAAARNQAVMSEPEIQEGNATPGIWSTIFMPVFPPNLVVATSEQRQAGFTGLVFIPINLGPMLDELTLDAAGLQISLQASQANKPFFTTPRIYPVNSRTKPYRGDFNIYGNQWSVHIAADTSIGFELYTAQTVTPVLGSVLSSLLASYLLGFGLTTIARRRQAGLLQARLAAIVQSVDECIIGEDLNGRITSWNESAETLFGRREDEVLGLQASEIMALEVRAARNDKASDIAGLASARAPQACTRTNADGARQSLLMSVSQIHDDRDQLVGYARVIRDVTQQNLLEAELLESQKLQAVGLLSGGLAHDFNNLLGIVVGNLDELEKRINPSEPGAKPYLAAAQDAAARGSQVAQSLLGIARQQPMDISTRDVNEQLTELRPLLQSSVGSKIALSLQLHQRPLLVRLDISQFSNAILNLIMNARDALAEKSGDKSIIVSTALVSAQVSSAIPDLSAQEHALVSVADNGIGMSDEVRRRAFEPFYTTKKIGEGTGLGLPMVRGFVQQLGGTVTLTNSPGTGLIVNLYLPLQSSPQQSEQDEGTTQSPSPALAAASAPAPESNTTSQKIVLLVDDEVELIQLASQWFTELGYRVFTASSPKEAKYLLGLEKINLLFTDVVMPGAESGIDLANWARLRDPKLRILFASGYAPGLAQDSAMLGPLLQKPYRKKDLVRLLANWPAAHPPKGSSS